MTYAIEAHGLTKWFGSTPAPPAEIADLHAGQSRRAQHHGLTSFLSPSTTSQKANERPDGVRSSSGSSAERVARRVVCCCLMSGLSLHGW